MTVAMAACGLKHDLSHFVDRLASHSRLGEAEQEALLALPAQLLTVDAHRDFVRLNQTVDHVSIVVDGMVGRFGQNADGERQLIALHIAGDAPDLHLMVVPTDTVPLQALSNSRVLRVPHNALRKLTARYPAIAEALWRHCSIDAGITARWVVNLGRRDAKTRIAHLLCEMAVRYDAIADGGAVTFSLPLTHVHLSDATGVTCVHVSRTIKALKEEGLAVVSDRTVQIPDWGKLLRQAEFEASYLKGGRSSG